MAPDMEAIRRRIDAQWERCQRKDQAEPAKEADTGGPAGSGESGEQRSTGC